MDKSRYPEETVGPAPSLVKKMEKEKTLELERAFAADPNFKKKPWQAGVKRRMFAEDDEFFPMERSEGFFDPPNGIRLSRNIYVREEFVTDKNQFFVFWVKRNFCMDNPQIDDSYLKVSSYERPSLKEILDDIIDMVEKNPPHLPLPCLANSPDGNIEDKDDVRFWSPDFTYEIGSGSLKARPYRDKYGTYHVRMLSPRIGNGNWIGISMSMEIGTAKKFRNVLDMYSKGEKKPKVFETIELDSDTTDSTGRSQYELSFVQNSQPAEELLQSPETNPPRTRKAKIVVRRKQSRATQTVQEIGRENTQFN